VTLRREKMYEFLDRLITIALPRVRDFRGVSPEELRRPRQTTRSASREQIVFPEIDYDKIDEVPRHGHHHRDHRPKTDAEARALLKGFDMPFVN